MKEFNEAQSINEYLISELVIARKQNEVLTERITTLVQNLSDISDSFNAFVKCL